MVTGIVCSLLLFTKSDKKPSNKFLGLGILGFVWLNTKILLHSLNLWEIHGFGFFPNGIELALPPLFYFCCISLIEPNFKFTKKDWLHYLPFFLSQLYAIVVYVSIMQTPLLLEKNKIANSLYFNEVKSLEDHLLLISALIYFYIGYKHIQNYKHWLSRNTSDTQFSELGFLNTIFRWLLFMMVYYIINLVLNSFPDYDHDWRWQSSHVLVAMLVYYLGLVGYKNSETIPPDFSIKLDPPPKKSNVLVDLDMVTKFNDAISKKKVHLNPKLSLQELAKVLEVNESTLSNTINAHYKKNFRSLINSARVEEVKQRLLGEGASNLSLLGLAKECGFNSEASFYRIFKAETGYTPKQYLTKYSSE